MSPRVVCVCTGNICRSPMVEVMLRAGLGPGSPWTVGSAGLSAVPGMPASPQAVRVLKARGLDLSAHRSRPMNAGLAHSADLIVAMTHGHCDTLRVLYPETAGRIRLLTSFDPATVEDDLADPIGMPEEAYREVSNRIEAALPGLITHLEAMT